MRACLKKRDQEISDLQESHLLLEGSKIRDIDALHGKVEDIREANSHLTQLYEG